jgi:hypothetical protein
MRRPYLIHRLVIEAFVGPKPPGKGACHKDGNPLNNCVDNLYWGTQTENMMDCARHGKRRTRQRVTGGERRAIIELIGVGLSVAEQARRVGVHRQTITRIQREVLSVRS